MARMDIFLQYYNNKMIDEMFIHIFKLSMIPSEDWLEMQMETDTSLNSWQIILEVRWLIDEARAERPDIITKTLMIDYFY